MSTRSITDPQKRRFLAEVLKSARNMEHTAWSARRLEARANEAPPAEAREIRRYARAARKAAKLNLPRQARVAMKHAYAWVPRSMPLGGLAHPDTPKAEDYGF